MSEIDDFQLTPPPSEPKNKKEKRTPMMQQFMEAKAQEPDALLFFRMGDFYEMFYEDAIVGAEVLEIALTTRDRKSDNPIPMCGIPHHAMDNYIGKLISAGHRVAVCEQVEDPKQAKGLVKREITRVITPGTLLEDNLLEARENNYLCAVVSKKDSCAAAFVDLSTGEFKVSGYSSDNRWSRLQEDLTLQRPREIIYPSDSNIPEFILETMKRSLIHKQDDWWFGTEYAEEQLKTHFQVSTLDSFDFSNSAMIAACGGALQYLKEVQKADLQHLQDIRVMRSADAMLIDDVSRRNLELTESWMTGEKKDSLLGLMDKTTTSMGARLLRQWLLRPLIQPERIVTRHDAVEELVANPVLCSNLQASLKSVADMERLHTRIAMKSANARDIASLRRSIEILPDILHLVEAPASQLLKDLRDSIDPMQDISSFITTNLVEEPPLLLREGGLIAPGANPELDELRAIVKDNKTIISDIERREKGRTGIPNLKIKYNKVFGYYFEVSKGNLDLVPDDYIRKQTLVNAERFITQELKDFEGKVLTAQDRIVAIEFEMFCSIRDEIASHGNRIVKTARAIAQLDVLRAFAEIASLFNYCRPDMSSGKEIIINKGRHPVVERLRLEEPFIPNDTLLDNGENSLLLITGPNMGGKSTYLRQVALITIMAQMGSFVPARKAEIGIIDRIFTRIGASDFLARGHSTFMVEMSETANILRNASERSLIILDEVGRGTSTFDGLSIAWAVVEYIHDTPGLGTKTLFATHYHELTELESTLEGVKNFNVAAKEHGDDVIFLRTVVRGPSDQSYGIQVAKLAGMPREVVVRARQILKNLEKNEFTREGVPSIISDEPENQELEPQHPVVEKLRELDINQLTPMEALQLISKLKDEI